MVTIYAVAREYRDRDNYMATSKPVSDWYLVKAEAQLLCEKMNKPLLVELEQKNRREVESINRENKEYEALVAAGLREPREPFKPWYYTSLEEGFVIVKAQLIGLEIRADSEY